MAGEVKAGKSSSGKILLIILAVLILIGLGYWVYSRSKVGADVSGTATTSLGSSGGLSVYKYVIEGTMVSNQHTFGSFDFQVYRGMGGEAGKKIKVYIKQDATTVGTIGNKNQSTQTFYNNYLSFIEKRGLSKGEHLFISGERVFNEKDKSSYFIADAISLVIPSSEIVTTPPPTKTSGINYMYSKDGKWYERVTDKLSIKNGEQIRLVADWESTPSALPTWKIVSGNNNTIQAEMVNSREDSIELKITGINSSKEIKTDQITFSGNTGSSTFKIEVSPST